MAISQQRYIRIGSSAFRGVSGRSFQGLVFSNGTIAKTGSVKTDYDAGKMITLTNSEVADYFASSSNEYKFAQKYFSCILPSGTSPETLNFIKFDTDESDGPSESEALSDAIAKYGDRFGGFTFLHLDDADEGTSIESVAVTNAGENFGHLYCVGFSTENTVSNVATAVSNGLADVEGTVAVYGNMSAAIPMALFAATDYNGVNAALCHMYKTFGGETETIDSDSDANTADAAHLNYYGITKMAGEDISFYQRGFNTNGLDTAVYCNEMWLKSYIAQELMAAFLNTNRIPANDMGNSMIANIIESCIGKAKNNGTIMPGKTLNQSQITKVLSLANNNPEAVDSVESSGYWLNTWIDGDGSEYVAHYLLIYSKGDSIRKVEGTNNLI